MPSCSAGLACKHLSRLPVSRELSGLRHTQGLRTGQRLCWGSAGRRRGLCQLETCGHFQAWRGSWEREQWETQLQTAFLWSDEAWHSRKGGPLETFPPKTACSRPVLEHVVAGGGRQGQAPHRPASQVGRREVAAVQTQAGPFLEAREDCACSSAPRPAWACPLPPSPAYTHHHTSAQADG